MYAISSPHTWAAYRRTEHYHDFVDTWNRLHHSWEVPRFYTYYAVNGPKKLGKIGDNLTVSLHLFLVDTQTGQEYPMLGDSSKLAELAPDQYENFDEIGAIHCIISIQNKKKIADGRYAITACITKFTDEKIIIMLPVDQPEARRATYAVPSKLDIFHMIYSTSQPFDGIHRGVIDSWFDHEHSVPQYLPPRFHLGNRLPCINPMFQISYCVDMDSMFKLPEIARSKASLGLPIARNIYTRSGKFYPPNDNETAFLHLQALSYFETPTTDPYDRPTFQLTAGILRQSRCAERPTSIFSAQDSDLSIAKLLRPGNVITITGLCHDSKTPARSYECYITHIAGANLPKAGVFPFFPTLS